MAVLAALFFATALLYASVGFGGGSTYNALLVLQGVDYRVLPAIALICNVIVVAGGAMRHQAAGNIDWARIWPFFAASVPMAWIGGLLQIPELAFIGVLGGALVAAGLNLLLASPTGTAAEKRDLGTARSAAVGGALGLLAGLVGIGGGIFLAPILHMTRWGSAQAIAATCSTFILINSLSGLAGQFAKLEDLGQLAQLRVYWPLFPAVLIGGQIGGALSLARLSEATMRRLTAALVLFVGLRLCLRFFRDAAALV
ncbi:MAG: sulfite exporter TauE/SafE family protein [Pseudomonadota bacterium]